MPSNMSSRWRAKKAVLVAVYVEAPRKKSLLTNNNNHKPRHHHVHHHHHLIVHNKPRQGYNRRAELLDYSRRLRESATSHKAPLLQLQPKPAVSLQRSRSQVIPVQKKLKPVKVPTCFGTLTIRLPGFYGDKREREKRGKKGQSTKEKMKSIVKIFQVKRKDGFFSRMFGSLRRKR